MGKIKLECTIEILVDTELTSYDEMLDSINVDVYSNDSSVLEVYDSEISSLNSLE